MSYSPQGLIETLGVFYYILVYSIGIVAMAFSALSFQLKHRVGIILGNFFGQSCWVIYFFLQGDVTSAIACALSAIMLATFAKKDKWNWATHPVMVLVFIILISGFSLLSFKVWSDIFPLLAGVFAVISNSRATEKRLRQFAVLWCFFWLLNSVFKLYPVALVNDFLCTTSTIIALIRYKEKDKKVINT